MLTSPFFLMSTRALVPSIVIAAVFALLAYLMMNRIGAPLADLHPYGANLPRNLVKAEKPAEKAKEVVQSLRGLPSGLEAAVCVFALDFVFLAAIYLGLAWGCEAVGRYWSGQPVVPRFAGLFAWLALLSAICDVLEDTVWLRMIRHGAFRLGSLAAWATRVKFLTLFIVIFFLIVSILLRVVNGRR